MSDRADVVIIGAGFAGLIAARDLGQRGHRVVVLEARDRVSGRTHYREFPDAGRSIELGGHWIHLETQWPIRDECARYGIALAETAEAGTARWFLGGELRGAFPLTREDRESLERVTKAVASAANGLNGASNDELRPHDVSIADWLAPLAPTPLVRELIYAKTSASAGALPYEHPMLAILQLVGQGVNAPSLSGGVHHHFEDGTRALATAIAADVPGEIRFETPVSAIRETDNGVTVTTARGTVEAAVAILAVPINVMPHIAFAPPLAPERMAALEEGNVCTVSKVWMLATGVPERLSGTGWDTPFCMVIAEPAGDAQLVVGFALQGALDPNDRDAVEAALQVYAPEARVLAVAWHDWTNDPWARGGWMSEPPTWTTGGVLDLLAQPHGRVLMAGADVASQFAGWIAGAIVSGHEAADAAECILAAAR
ncbi:MAG: NAD(P)/FAD-dependent oxidoreductase [Thermomicrobiales bacterium]